jgi:excinuclease ABC subunit C
VIGLAKDDHHQTERIVLDDNTEITFSKHDKLFLLLASMQDEVHRYAISFFRNNKNKSMLSSLLDNIPGIGKKKKNILLRVYPTLDAIKDSSVAQLSQFIGVKEAEIVLKTLQSQQI